jgi:anti-sigma regulatory factor (Ser/Thr protein kinase)
MTVLDIEPGAGGADAGFRHEALLYATEREFIQGTTAFLREGVRAGDAVLTVVDAAKIRAIRAALGADAAHVQFADMAEVGRNPALIIQAWRDFAAAHTGSGRRLRGIGEPISARRSPAALDECHIHEALLNLAFRDHASFRLVCPYDTSALPRAVVDQAVHNHPFVCDHSGGSTTGTHPSDDLPGFTRPLPAPPVDAATVDFDADTVTRLRRFVTTEAVAGGVGPDRARELAVAASEIATNAVVHGRGGGHARTWIEGRHVVCEIRGPGRITDPLVGRLRPVTGEPHGYGIWLANHFCDLVQIRSGADGTTVRLHVPLT